MGSVYAHSLPGHLSRASAGTKKMEREVANTRKAGVKSKPRSRKKTSPAKAARKPAASKAAAKSRSGNGARARSVDPARQARMAAASFGEIVGVLMRSPHYRHYSLADLEWLVVPPLLANQFTLAASRTKEGGIPAPIGVALWARVSDEVDKKLSTGLDRPVRLRPDEWTSGETLWLIDAVGAPDAVKAMVGGIGKAMFDGKPFKLRARDKDGNVSVQTIDPMANQEPKGTP